MSDSNASVVKIGRPSIGPRIDFRVPEDARDLVAEWARRNERPEDEICREVFLRGIEAALSTRTYGREVRPARPIVARLGGR